MLHVKRLIYCFCGVPKWGGATSFPAQSRRGAKDTYRPSREQEKKMVKYREIRRLHAMGVSIRNIAFSCRCSTATVRAVTGRARAAGIEWPLPEETGDRAIRKAIYPPKSKADPNKAPIDHDHIDAEMPRPSVTMTLLWSEYCESTVSQGRSPYMYSAFCERASGRCRTRPPCASPTNPPSRCRWTTSATPWRSSIWTQGRCSRSTCSRHTCPSQGSSTRRAPTT